MTEHAANSASRVEGKDIRGNVVTLKRTNPAQLSLFQTFIPDDDKYSNTIGRVSDLYLLTSDR